MFAENDESTTSEPFIQDYGRHGNPATVCHTPHRKRPENPPDKKTGCLHTAGVWRFSTAALLPPHREGCTKGHEGRSHAGREAWKRADYSPPHSSPRTLARKLPHDGEIRITTNSFERTSMRLFFTKKELRLRRRRLVAMAACTIVLLAGYIVWTWPRKTEPEAPTVVVTPAKTGDVEIYGEYVGRIRAQQFVEVHARVEGYLEKMLFAEGTYVTKNQVLFVINQAQYKAKADKARAQLKKDEAQALKAQRDLDRIRPLYEQNAASRLDLDNALAAYETAEASVAMSRADLAQAELELGYTIVRSPLSGHISERNVDLGTLVGPSGKSLLATVVKSDTVLVDFSMTALDYLKSKERNVEIGRQDSSRSWQPNITITLPDNTVYPYRGFVDFAEPQVDPQTGTFSVRAEMPNPDRTLLPGQFTRVKLLLDVRKGAVSVPQKAITIEKGGAYIFVMRRDSVVERRFVELGPEYGNNTVVERGLAAGEQVVTEGFHKLTPGMRVRPQRAAARPKA